MKNDQYFTSASLADELALAVTLRRVDVVADFAAGHGELLQALHARWPTASIIANDIDAACVANMANEHPEWRCSNVDFELANAASQEHGILRVGEKCCLVVLNPPYSGRGAKCYGVCVRGVQVRCSRAMMFVLKAIESVRRGGQVVAILPESCMFSVKDRRAREVLDRIAVIEVLRRGDKGEFPGCAARTCFVRITCSKPRSGMVIAAPLVANAEHVGDGLSVVRGNFPVYKSKITQNGVAFVHTTSLRNHRVQSMTIVEQRSGRTICGPAILLPRVGLPQSGKCCLYLSRRRIMLSDCVIGIQFDDRGVAVRCHKRILEFWQIVESAFKGTGAPYITIDTLCERLRRIGIGIRES